MGRPRIYTDEERVEARRASARRYANSTKGKTALRAWTDNHQEAVKAIKARYRSTEAARAGRRRHRIRHEANQPLKVAARKTLNHAIESGRIIKPSTCSRCGGGGTIHGHHADYSKPLEVEWLCINCHTAVHS